MFRYALAISHCAENFIGLAGWHIYFHALLQSPVNFKANNEIGKYFRIIMIIMTKVIIRQNMSSQEMYEL